MHFEIPMLVDAIPAKYPEANDRMFFGNELDVCLNLVGKE